MRIEVREQIQSGSSKTVLSYNTTAKNEYRHHKNDRRIGPRTGPETDRVRRPEGGKCVRRGQGTPRGRTPACPAGGRGQLSRRARPRCVIQPDHRTGRTPRTTRRTTEAGRTDRRTRPRRTRHRGRKQVHGSPARSVAGGWKRCYEIHFEPPKPRRSRRGYGGDSRGSFIGYRSTLRPGYSTDRNT